ncbi:MAG: DUF6498-containing protein [Planctomycetota bacterium]|jgi:predicted RNA-binding Zn-ribbon protein involved in translation (DUF1610 family)
MIRFACSNCNLLFSIDQKHSGKKYKCPKCGDVVLVPKRSTIIVFACDSCGYKIRAPESYDGKKGACPKCKNPVIVCSPKNALSESAGTVTVTHSTREQITEVPEGSSEEPIKASDSSSHTESSYDNIPIASKKSKVSFPHDISVIALLAANTIPLFGVFFFDWDAFLIVFLCCSENIVIGFYNILKMAFVAVLQPSDFHGLKFQERINLFLAWIPFFSLHYGIFAFGLCSIVCELFDKPDFVFKKLAYWPTEIKIAFMALFISHGVSFVRNYVLKREFASVHTIFLMIGPYGRVILTIIALIAGGFLVQTLGSPTPLLVILVVLKTSLDLTFHLLGHKKIIVITDGQKSATKDELKPTVKEKEVGCKEEVSVSSPSSSRKSLSYRIGRLVSLCWARLSSRKSR